MLRNLLLCGLMVSAMVVIGCAKREGDPPRAETAKAGLMPSVDKGFEPTYIADQKQITMAGEVQVSLEPLESFREAKAQARAEASEDGGESGAMSDPATSQSDDEWEEEDDDAWEDDDKAKPAGSDETNEATSEEDEGEEAEG